MIQDTTRPRRAPRCLLLATMLTAGPALGQSIYAEYRAGGTWQPLPGFPSRAAGQTGLPSGADLTINLTAFQTVRVYADQPDKTDVGTITVNAPPGIFPHIQVTALETPNFSSAAPKGPKAFRAVGGVVAPAGVVMLHADTITGVGVEARQILRLDLADDLDAPLLHWGEPSGSTSRFIAAIDIDGSTTERGSIVAVNGPVYRITIDGDARGSIAAQNGGLNALTVGGDLGGADQTCAVYAWSGPFYYAIGNLAVGGTIGTPERPVEIATGGPVRFIEADAVHAHINTTLDPADPGFFGGLTARAGDFTGSLLAQTLTSFGYDPGATCALQINGDLDAFVYFANGTRNERRNGPEIDIAGAVRQNAVLSLATMITSDPSQPGPQIRVGADAGVAGQIIAGDNLDNTFAGGASILVGTTDQLLVTPDTKFYDKLAFELGGGAVGIPPFNFHPRDSFPEHNETLTLADGERLETAVIRLYGPAFAAAQPAFLVEHQPVADGPWVDRSADFAIDLAVLEADASREIRVTGLAGAFFEPGQWRLRPADDTITCAFTRNSPAIRFDSEYDDDTYRFVVVGGCSDRPGSGFTPTTAGRTPTGDNPVRLDDLGDNISPDNDCP